MNVVHFSRAVHEPRPSGACPRCGQFPQDCECNPRPPSNTPAEFVLSRFDRFGRRAWPFVMVGAFSAFVALATVVITQGN